MSAARRKRRESVPGVHPLDERYVAAYARDEVSGDGLVRCPLCGAPLVPSRRHRAGHRYYRHASGADDERCPLTTPSYQPEGIAVGRPYDPEVGPVQRARFVRLWRRHYRMARASAPGLTLERFSELVALADVLNLWSYPSLDQRDLPYVLLAMAGFMAQRDERGEPVRVRFWFDWTVREVGQLWDAGRAAEPRLFRLVYRNPLHTPLPSGADLLHWEPVERAARLADIRTPVVARPELRAFARFLDESARERARREANDGRDGVDFDGSPE
ncbi:zinc ribbon domain-containing protein [Trinickia caryophylli]|uniref:Uncharacterized protein n=1 Tax=Trinickia caryophylli TaxID=28094 RepID=A0A1X7H5B3_TRICW|nr:zinc ribbon domain-containing protein [Trinickia caryophylli]PMS09615.1 hypothetical protein C0Z17_24285 [Trinickia caryophylli]TRX17248.1 hypothetical protein FNF07_02700 [Trinickia caryophylli]WQE12017.1 zinc ribbon domain-containing protein [Trinickia caryophylli]SMF79780.1 hypothetical protein SAMN06295900_12199 [Trinickia caryophylli]GLU35590.1 hypothetical protein Busp01_54320 [Trinickia caryophylli]